METRDHPETIRRWETAHLEGSATDAGCARTEQVLDNYRRRSIVALFRSVDWSR